MNLDQFIEKVPKPVLVFVVLVISLLLFVRLNPLQDGCSVEVVNFKEKTKGYLFNTQTSGKILSKNKIKATKFAEIETSKAMCKEGNSLGSCHNYFNALKVLSDSLLSFDHRCLVKLAEDEELPQLISQMKEGIKILALAAWGEVPPESISQRLGWLSATEVQTYCRLRNNLLELIGEEDYISFRRSVYQEFPDHWPKNLDVSQLDVKDIRKPMAYKSVTNPSGSLSEKEIHELSLFSVRCDASL